MQAARSPCAPEKASGVFVSDTRGRDRDNEAGGRAGVFGVPGRPRNCRRSPFRPVIRQADEVFRVENRRSRRRANTFPRAARSPRGTVTRSVTRAHAVVLHGCRHERKVGAREGSPSVDETDPTTRAQRFSRRASWNYSVETMKITGRKSPGNAAESASLRGQDLRSGARQRAPRSS